MEETCPLCGSENWKRDSDDPDAIYCRNCGARRTRAGMVESMFPAYVVDNPDGECRAP